MIHVRASSFPVEVEVEVEVEVILLWFEILVPDYADQARQAASS